MHTSPDLTSRDRSQSGRRGFTLTELLIGSSVASLVVGGVMVLLIESAKEQRRALADTMVNQVACELQDKVMRLMREMSATEGVIYTSPATNDTGLVIGFSRIIVARGPAPDFPRAEIRFDAGDGRAIYDPNRTASSDEQVLLSSEPSAYVLQRLYFQPTLKTDGTPDNSLVNVVIEVDDNGSSGRRPDANPAHVQRTFSVKMRNS